MSDFFADAAGPRNGVVVSGSIEDGAPLTGQAGLSEFSIGGPDGRGGIAPGPNPYDLLSASLAACTAMTIRVHARRKKLPLSNVEVAVSYHHSPDGGRDAFDRAITLHGDLNDQQHDQLLQIANFCPVGRTLGLNADIRTTIGTPPQKQSQADYLKDVEELPIPYIDAD